MIEPNGAQVLLGEGTFAVARRPAPTKRVLMEGTATQVDTIAYDRDRRLSDYRDLTRTTLPLAACQFAQAISMRTK